MGIFNRSSTLPEYWNAYVKTFDKHLPKLFQELTFVVLDTETTGFDKTEDRILSIGALKLKNNLIHVDDVFDVYIEQKKFNEKSIAIHGILNNSKRDCISEELAIQKFLEYVGNNVVVAHHAGFDIGMINSALKRLGLPKLKNKSLDTGVLYKQTLIKSYLVQPQEHYSLDDLAEKYSISKKDRHTALGDAYITALAFVKILSKIKEKKVLSLKNLR
ncbi:3'-5' exonuclease [Maribacter cobaltidurans]|uniref:DNA polymerase III subunit epsilon n=1 Tax=Maribacter cobaltidurans TaxID=1178778 RepID=A0A223V080_9FLAO|nr:3'-5' exonuclease [Maribacter cobaltidurans]ASV28825.1 DNA polymerase III subunit epsilon [Maribacter cobaltidurans]GGD74494.1 DNA polymerase III subunit epsilon [Maribacter cobaltidurans]